MRSRALVPSQRSIRRYSPTGCVTSEKNRERTEKPQETPVVYSEVKIFEIVSNKRSVYGEYKLSGDIV